MLSCSLTLCDFIIVRNTITNITVLAWRYEEQTAAEVLTFVPNPIALSTLISNVSAFGIPYIKFNQLLCVLIVLEEYL